MFIECEYLKIRAEFPKAPKAFFNNAVGRGIAEANVARSTKALARNDGDFFFFKNTRSEISRAKSELFDIREEIEGPLSTRTINPINAL